MSTRWYPRYVRGNPQLRIFLPNFWLKLVKPTEKLPNNVVQMVVSTQMTRLDVRNYLEKIYKVPVVHVATAIVSGKTRRLPGAGYVVKDDDYKLAFVTLPEGTNFEFPDLFPEKEEESKHDRSLEEAKKHYNKNLVRNKDRPGVPGWFSL